MTVPKPRNPDQSSWKIRRRFMFSVSAFCAWVIVYCLVQDKTSGVADTAVTMAFMTLISILGAYVFGATWEDASIRKLFNTKETKDADVPTGT